MHGSPLGPRWQQWLLDNCQQVERCVREVLAAAVQNLPPGKAERLNALAGLYDLTDTDRGDLALEKFKEIKSAEVRKAIADKILEPMRK